MSDEKTMVYVAADPKQPGAAWAICVDRPEWAKDTAKTISDWIKRGANVQRVGLEEGKEMIQRWVKPKVSKGQKELL
jgi:hypothetical protein